MYKLIVPFMLICLFMPFFGCDSSLETRKQKLLLKADEFAHKKLYFRELQLLEKASFLGAPDVGIYIKMYNLFLKLNDLENAEKILFEILKIDSRHKFALLEMIKINLIKDEVGKAETYLQKVRSIGKDDPIIHLLEGDVKFLQADYFSAKESYNKALVENPDFDIARAKLAKVAIAEGNTKDAEQYIQALNTKDIRSPGLLVEIADYYSYRGDDIQAEQLYRQAVDIDPASIMAKERLAEFFLEIGNYDKAFKIQQELASLYPDSLRLKKGLVETLLIIGRTDEAMQIVDECLKQNENDEDLILLNGYIDLSDHRVIPAVMQFDKILEKNEAQPLVYYLIGLAHMVDGHIELANQTLSKALIYYPNFIEAELALAGLYYKEEEYELCLEAAERILDGQPENIRALMLKTSALVNTGKYQIAEAICLRMLALAPQHEGALYNLAICLTESGREKDALSIFLRMLEKEPPRIDICEQYAVLMLQMDRGNEAALRITEILENYPENAILWSLLGALYYRTGKMPDAERAFIKANKSQPKIALPYLYLIKIYRFNHQPEKEEAIINRSLLNLDDCPECFTEAGFFHLNMGNYDKAIEILKQAYKRYPGDETIANNLAFLLSEKNDNLNLALTLAQTAYEKKPNESAFSDTLGRILAKKGLHAQADWYLQKAKQ